MDKNCIEIYDIIDKMEIINNVGYFIKIICKKITGSFFNREENTVCFFLNSLDEIPSKYIHYKVKSIQISSITKKELKSLKKIYENIKSIPAILEIYIEYKED